MKTLILAPLKHQGRKWEQSVVVCLRTFPLCLCSVCGVGSAPDQNEAFGAGEARPHEALTYALQYGLLWQQMVLMFDVMLLGLLNVESLYRTVLYHTATLHYYVLFCQK